MIRVSASQIPAIVLVALVAIALVLYRDTALSLVRLWTSPDNPTYSHGLLLVAVCTFLAFRRWPKVAKALPSRPNVLGLLTVLGASFLWFLASLVQVLIVQQLSLLLLVAGIVFSVTGYRGAHLLAVPMALMIFAVPVWRPLNSHLQHMTASVVNFLVNLTGVPALLEGTTISVPAGAFEVAPSCSGLAQLIVGMMVGVLYAYTTGQRLRSGLWLFVGATAVSILSNTVRIYTVVMAGQLTAMQHYFVTTDHWTLGWVLFGVFMAGFVLAANRFAPPVETRPASARTSSTSVRQALRGGGAAAFGAPLIFCALIIGPLLAYAYRHESGARAVYVLNLPPRIGEWQALQPPPGYYRPSFVGPDLEGQRLYRASGGEEAYLYVAYYATQRQGKEAVYYLNRVYDGKGWKAISNSTRSMNPGKVVETRIRSQGGAEKTVWHWYYAGGVRTSSDYRAKILNLWETLKGNPSMAIIVAATDVDKGDGQRAAALLERFVTEVLQPLERAIDGAQART